MPVLVDNKMPAAYEGLTSKEAALRLEKNGKNELPLRKKKNFLIRFLGIVSEPMLLILLATTVVYYFIGTKIESLILGLSIIPVILIEFFQEQRTDQAIEALDALLVDNCRAYRDGKLTKILSNEVVPGDLIYLSAGDKIPADGVILRSPGFLVDESILTGESVPINKVEMEIDQGEKSRLFQGTMAVEGEAYMMVERTGAETNYGKLGNLLQSIENKETPLQQKVKNLVRKLAIAAICIAIFIGLMVSLREGILKGILGALTIAMSIIPEEFPIVFSVFLIMGVWRLSKKQALVRKMVMVETLGSVNVICTDKTGTITEGKMSLQKFYTKGLLLEPNSENPDIYSLIKAAILALERIVIDPLEVEIQRYAKDKKIIGSDFYDSLKLVKDSTFNPATKMVSHIWQEGKKLTQYTAGAPEMVMEACKLTSAQKKELIKVYEQLASEGGRVVAVAETPAQKGEFMSDGLAFSGLIAMTDPPRQGVKEALNVCRKAGVRVMMITGDHALTAAAIARSVGLEIEQEPVTGADLDKMSKAEIDEVVKTRNIFARIRPEQKYLIVEALEKNGEIVAMTGDGVNDAPALKKAVIGVAMGQKGTAVARAAAGIVLLDDNFTTIVGSIEEGRRIYNNLQEAFLFLFTFHIPLVGMSLIPLLLGRELYFLPIHIIFLELFCDPTTVLGFEKDPLPQEIMSRPPRPADEPIISRELWWKIFLQSSGILMLCLCFYWYGISSGNLALGRTMSFFALVISQIILVFVNRSPDQVKKNTVLLTLLLITAVALHLLVFFPPAVSLFHFYPLDVNQYLAVFLISIITMVFFSEIEKRT